MRGIFLFILFLQNFHGFAQNSVEIFHKARIFIQSQADLIILNDLGLSMDHGHKKTNTYIESDFSEQEIELAETHGFMVDVLVEDVAQYYRQQNLRPISRSTENTVCQSGSQEYQTPENFNIWPASDFGGFYTYSQLLQELDDMFSLYPNLITAKADISSFTTEGTPDSGTSPPIGGNTIKWVKISDNPNSNSEGEPQVLYTSLHHAREPASLSQLLFFMWYLLENYDTDEEIQALVDNTELYFVPVVNPDGYLYNELTDPNGGGLWRKNRKDGNGVDNNRNYDYYIDGDPSNNTWGGPGSSSNPASPLYHGTGPFSEVENQAMRWFVEQHDFVLALNNHTFGELIYYPFGYADVPTPDDDIYQGITNLLTSQSGYSAVRDFPFSGDSDDFMYGTVGTHQKIFAMTPEIGPSFWPPQSSIEAICKEMMFTNLSAAQISGNYATLIDLSEPFLNSTPGLASYGIQRVGLAEPANFTVSVNPISSNIIDVGSSIQHSGLNFQEEMTSAISLTLDPAINVGDPVIYELIVNNGLYDKKVTVNRTFGSAVTLFEEPGDDTTTNWELTSWNATTEDFTSAPSSITDSPNAVYDNNSNVEIVLSDPIDLSGAASAYLNFNARWEIEDGFDFAQIEISTNNGLSWIPQCGNYTTTGSSSQAGASDEPVYDGSQTEWIQETIDLSDYLGENILLRFKLVSDGSVRQDGFYFDDLKVRVVQSNLSDDEFDVNAVSIYPNPATDILVINTGFDSFQLELYSTPGVKIFEMPISNKDHRLDISSLASGLYLLKISSKTGQRSFKIIVE